MRTRWRRLRFGLSTILGTKPLGFFVPYRYAASVEPLDYPALRPLFEEAQPRFRAVLDMIEAHSGDLRSLPERGPARFDQSWFPRLDAAAAYSLVRCEKPHRIVEIGSGHSTRFLAGAVADEGLSTEITCIDPAPRAALTDLPVRFVPTLLRDADRAILDALQAGDVLFIDSSHIAMPGTDVDRLFLHVLPRLAPGVLVHVHDVLLPEGYPQEWAWRGYSEQLLVGALLQGKGYEIVFASHYVAGTMQDSELPPILSELPLPSGAFETSLWLRKR